mmetsp:Transcript_12146/g.36089  ORF Transcript_12146/g.36089 Transcript_12146/m.36089 type:complete len:427 (-) Transcript_12146:26-1306(-)
MPSPRAAESGRHGRRRRHRAREHVRRDVGGDQRGPDGLRHGHVLRGHRALRLHRRLPGRRLRPQGVVRQPENRQLERPLHAPRHGRGPGGRGGRRAAHRRVRVRRDAPRSRGRHGGQRVRGHRHGREAAGHAAEPGPAAGVALCDPRAAGQHGLGHHRHRAQRQGPELWRRVRVRVRHARDRRGHARHPARRLRRRRLRRLRGGHDAAHVRRLWRHEGHVRGLQRRPGPGLEALRRRPRGLRHGRGRRRRRHRERRARRGAGRDRLRRARRLRRDVRRAPHHDAGARGRRPRAVPRQGARVRGRLPGGGGLRERARHVHGLQRQVRDHGAQDRVRQARLRPARVLHQGRDGPHHGRGRRHRGRAHGARGQARRLPADHQLRDAGPGLRPQLRDVGLREARRERGRHAEPGLRRPQRRARLQEGVAS